MYKQNVGKDTHNSTKEEKGMCIKKEKNKNESSSLYKSDGDSFSYSNNKIKYKKKRHKSRNSGIKRAKKSKRGPNGGPKYNGAHGHKRQEQAALHSTNESQGAEETCEVAIYGSKRANAADRNDTCMGETILAYAQTNKGVKTVGLYYTKRAHIRYTKEMIDDAYKYKKS